ncbi:MAG: ATP-grasp protein [Gammaproteobacteria bacterium]|jgi:biotin carboxylase|nr:ATP-grasp protein [Gammaproteobacteria bacterium]
MYMANLTILLVGFRKGALQAALALGYSVIIWQEKSIPKRYLKYLVSTITTPYPDLSSPVAIEICGKLAGYKLTAIIATTEKAVVVAAKLREQLQLTGTSREIAIRCHDKWVMKQAAEQAGAKLTPYFDLTRMPVSTVIEKLGFPIAIKQRCLSGSREIRFIHALHELSSASIEQGLAEKFVIGKEYSVESFIQDGKILFCNITEYYLPHIISIMPAELPENLHAEIVKLNRLIITHFQIKQGMTHLELYHTAEGIIFGEIALRPPGGYLMNLLELSYGFDAWQAFLCMELGLPFHFSQQALEVSAGWILHPGAGTIQNIAGVKDIKQHPLVKGFELKIKVGHQVNIRLGTGEDCGHILLAATQRTELLYSLDYLQQQLIIRLDTDLPLHNNPALHGQKQA